MYDAGGKKIMAEEVKGNSPFITEQKLPEWLEDDEPVLMSVGDAARMMSVTPAYLYELCKQNKLPTLRMGRRVLLNRKALLAWIEENTNHYS